MEIRYNVDSNAYALEKKKKGKGRTPKLARSWEGPFVIVKRINDLVYRIQRNKQSKTKVVHRNRLWKFRGEREDLWKDENLQSKPDDLVEKVHQLSDNDNEDMLQPTTTTLRRSGRKRKPRDVLNL